MAVVCLSVRLPVCLIPDLKSRMEEWKLKTGWQWQGDLWRHSEVERSKVKVSKQAQRRKMHHIFQREDWRTSNLVQVMTTMTRITDMRGDGKGQGHKVMSSVWLIHASYNSSTKTRRTPKLAGRLSMPRVTFRISFKVKRLRSPGRFMWQFVTTCRGRGHKSHSLLRTPSLAFVQHEQLFV